MPRVSVTEVPVRQNHLIWAPPVTRSYAVAGATERRILARPVTMNRLLSVTLLGSDHPTFLAGKVARSRRYATQREQDVAG
jgi:hypothetical protein